MKKIVLIIFTGAFLLGCGDKKAAKKAALDSVISIHDNVMAADDQLLKNKRELDTLIKKNNLSLRDSAALLSTRLADADSAMDIWMHNFDFEHEGKSYEFRTFLKEPGRARGAPHVTSEVNALRVPLRAPPLHFEN